MKRAVRIFLSLIFVSIPAGCGAPQRVDTAGPISFPSSEPGVVKAMSFNIRVDTLLDGLNRWAGRRQRVIDMLVDHTPDVIGLQEALDHQVLQIQQALPRYRHYAIGRTDGKRKGETCAIFYRKDRFTLGDSGTFWFSDTPSKPGSKDWGNLWPRICSWAYLKEKATGGGFYVYNVHLDVLSQNSRQKSAELLARRITARRTADPFIVMGDFNMELDNPAMAYLENLDFETPYPRMRTAWQLVHPGLAGGSTRHSFIDSPTSGPKIDHIPICDGARALDVQIDRRRIDGGYASDHFPLIAKIDLATRPEPFGSVAANIRPQKNP
ncbi:MAG: endonuclease/exonuclease/phosphatase family protein [Sedimentisphaerales bacterium]|jgi:endonuclease/exonuclease/phosphatase family metal-dependent hydrolase